MIPEKTDARQQIEYQPDKGAYYEWRLFVSDALRGAGYEADADAFWACASDEAVYFIPHKRTLPDDTDTKSLFVCLSDRSHRVKAVRCTCHLRICPDCARRASARLLARYMPKCRELIERQHPRFCFRKIVLTTDIDLRSGDIDEQYRKLRRAVPKVFDCLLPEHWRARQGLIVSDEFGPEGHKLHFHVVFYGGWIENRAEYETTLSSAWKAVTGGHGEVTWIGRVYPEDVENELIEALKYATKFWKRNPDGSVNRLDPELVVILRNVLDGVRRVRSYGIFYNLPLPEKKEPACPDCASPVVRLSVIEWNVFTETNWLPGDPSLLHLRLGNKSPPEQDVGHRGVPPESPETGAGGQKPTQLALAGKPKPKTSYDFEG
jgi:hypothetical protein